MTGWRRTRALPGKRAGDPIVRDERRRQRGQPGVRRRQRILNQQDDELAAGLLDAEVAGQAVIEGFRGDADQPIDAAAKQIGRAVGRSGVDGDDLERESRPAAAKSRRAARGEWPRRCASAARSTPTARSRRSVRPPAAAREHLGICLFPLPGIVADRLHLRTVRASSVESFRRSGSSMSRRSTAASSPGDAARKAGRCGHRRPGRRCRRCGRRRPECPP